MLDESENLDSVRSVQSSDDLASTGNQGQPNSLPRSKFMSFRNERFKRYMTGTVSVLVAMGLWQAIFSLHLTSPIILPGPSAVWSSFMQYLHTGQFAIDARYSGEELALGYISGCAAGVIFGLLFGYYKTLQNIVNPFLSFALAIPIIALAPLMLVWLGLGLLSKVAVIFAVCFFPVLLNTINGIKNVDPNLHRMSQAFCVRGVRYFRTVGVPSSVPYILAGMRLAIGHGLIGVFVAELLGANHGIGEMMDIASADFNTGRLFVGLIELGVAGLVLTGLLLRVEDHFSKWK